MKKLTCFKAYDIRGKLGEELNEDIAWRIGRAAVSHSLPDATLPRLIRPTNPNRRSDKAFTPHPTNSA